MARELVDAPDRRGREDPALVFLASGSGGHAEFDTPARPVRPSPSSLTSTAVMQAAYSTPVGGDTLKIGPETRLEWVQKSARNAFGGLITLGRTHNNDIAIDVSTVSKLHAVFTRDPKRGWLVWDANSTNGTYLDGLRLPREAKRPIDDGAELLFGPQVRAFFVLPESLDLLLARVRATASSSGRSGRVV